MNPPIPAPLRTRFIQTILPLLSSLALHVVVIAVGLATAGAIVRTARVVSEEQVTAASSQVPSGKAGDAPSIADLAKAQPSVLTAGLVESDAASVPQEVPRGDSLAARLRDGGGQAGGEGPAVSIGLGAGTLRAGSGDGKGARTGNGEGEGDGSARFGLPTGTGYGTGGGIFIPNRGARRIVFVCDATGTMINRFALLRIELARAIRQLQPVQAYNVVFFRDEGAAAASTQGLLLANSENRRKAQQFLEDFSPSGQTNPLPALRLAFAQKPELVYFLTDGEFNNLVTYEKVVAEITRLNAGQKARVNTISFGSHDAEAGEVLKRIARDNGGLYKHVSE